MKRLLMVLAAICLIGSLLLTACSNSAATTSSAAATTSSIPPTTSAASQAKYKFTYNNFFPPTHNNSILAEMWMAEIKKRTNGAVDFSYHPGASLTAANKVYDGVLTGISDIGFSVVSYTPGLFPASELIEYPQGYPSGYVATMVSNDYFKNFKPAEFDKVHVFYFYATGPQVIFSTKKEVAKLEDLKGMVLRSTGIGAKIATALGASGYAAAQNEAYELMSKGVIDGSIAPREVLLGWKQGDVVNYVTNCFSVGSVSNMYVVMNKSKWDSLPADVQKIFDEVSQAWAEYHAKVSSAYDQGGMEYFNAQPNRKEINQDAAESARWAEKVKPLVDETISSIKSKGLPGDEYEQYIRDRIKYWTEKAVSDADCLKWVKDNVKKP